LVIVLEVRCGKIKINIASDAVCVGSPTVIQVIRRGSDDVFVLPYFSCEKIEVYDAKTFTFQRHIVVLGLGRFSYGLASYPHNNCLYACDHYNDSIHRVELSGSNTVMKWSVARGPVGLSVNSEHNLLVVSAREMKLQVFATRGTLLQNIQLQADIERPLHAVQLPTGQFLVSHSLLGLHRDIDADNDNDNDKPRPIVLDRVCLVGVDGAVVRSYGGKRGSQLTQMYGPRYLSVDREGRVLVADRNNDRLLVIDQSLSSAHEMSVCVDGGLQCPYSLWYDQSRRRLYIGELDGGRVIVIDNLKDFTVAQVNA